MIISKNLKSRRFSNYYEKIKQEDSFNFLINFHVIY